MAAQAAFSGQMLEILPASFTKARCADYNPTPRASFGEGKVYSSLQKLHSILVPQKWLMHKRSMSREDLFSRTRRRAQFARATGFAKEDRWVLAHMAQELVTRGQVDLERAGNVLLVGHDAGVEAACRVVSSAQTIKARLAQSSHHCPNLLACDEDRLGIADNSMDMVLALGSLDSVNDLPGALILMRRALRPGGLFLGAFLGSGSLALLRELTQPGEQDATIAQRFHPLVDVRAAGDLLMRAGFQQPVADTETLNARYGSLDRLVADVRANGLSNALANHYPLTRAAALRWKTAFKAQAAAEGKATEQFWPLYLTGRSPG